MNKKDRLPFIAANLNELGSLFHDLLGGGAFLGPDRRTNIARYKILKSLDVSRVHCLTDISNRVHCKKNTLSEILDRMVHDGLVLRCNNDCDRRKTNLAITAAGRAAIRNFEQAFIRVMNDYLATLPAPLRESFLNSLGALVEISLSCQRNDACPEKKIKSR
jgi:DNA-binding MarR family transcriptional regulator